MKRLFLCLFGLLALGCEASAANYYKASITITAAPPALATFTVNGNTRTWSNQTTATLILTNGNVNFATTNLFNAIVDFPYTAPVLKLTWQNTNSIGLRGDPLVISASAGWASITILTNTGPDQWAVTVPFDNLYDTNRTNNASELAYGIGKYSTNPISGIRLTNVAGLHGSVTKLDGGWLTNSAMDKPNITNGVANGLWPTNVIRLHGTNHLLSGGTIADYVGTNGIYTNIAWMNGTVGGTLTGGTFDGGRPTNQVGIHGSVNKVTGGWFTNSALDNPKLTNGVNYGNAFSSPGAGTDSEQFGKNATSGGALSLAVGNDADSAGTESTSLGFAARSLGYQSTAVGNASLVSASAAWGIALGFTSTVGANATNGIALGTGSQVTGSNGVAIGPLAIASTNEVALGNSSHNVKAPGRISGNLSNIVALSNSTNVWKGDISFPWVTTITTVVDGNNKIDVGTNVCVQISGETTTTWKLHGMTGGARDGKFFYLWNRDTGNAMQVVNEAGTESVPTDRIRSVTGGDFVIPTNGIVLVSYAAVQGGVSRWLVAPLTMTNAVIGNDHVTDSHLRNSVGTSVIGRSATSTGDPADIQLTADGQVLVRSNAVLQAGKIALTNASIYNVNPVGMASGDNLVWDVTSNVWTNKAEVGYQMLFSGPYNSIWPSDGVTLYIGMVQYPVGGGGSTYVNVRVPVQKKGTLKRWDLAIRVHGTIGSGETVSHYLRVNDTTDVGQIDTALNTANIRLSATVSQAVVEGDFLAMKIVCPTWATNPDNVYWEGRAYIE